MALQKQMLSFKSPLQKSLWYHFSKISPAKMFSDAFKCIGTIPLENGLVEYFILHFIEMCALKTLVQFAIFHLAQATAGAWTISEGLYS